MRRGNHPIEPWLWFVILITAVVLTTLLPRPVSQAGEPQTTSRTRQFGTVVPVELGFDFEVKKVSTRRAGSSEC